MAHGLGVLGLRLSDLEQLTPDEFAAVCDAHHEQAEAALADHWTRARLMTTLSLQPRAASPPSSFSPCRGMPPDRAPMPPSSAPKLSASAPTSSPHV